MRRVVLAIAFLIAGFAASLSVDTALARDVNVAADHASDLSAAKKKKQKQYVRVYRAPQPQRVGRPWMDPSFDEYGRPYRSPYPPQQCVFDLGYGRFEPCDNVF
jgi:hypothetical protein